MKFFPKKIIGIDLHDYSAEVVALKQQGKELLLEAFNIIEIPDDIIRNSEIQKRDQLKALIQKLLLEANPKPLGVKDVAVIFPSNKVLTHIFTFPLSLAEKDVKTSIPYESETVIPFSIEDVYWDIVTIAKDPESQKNPKQYVLFACIDKALADSYASTLEEIGLNPVLFAIHAEALKYGLESQFEKSKNSIIIDMETTSVNYLIVKDGSIRYFFAANEGGRELISQISQDLKITENTFITEKNKGKFQPINDSPELNAFINNNFRRGQRIIEEQIKQLGIKSIDNVYLTGEFINFSDFLSKAKEFFPTQKISVGDPKIELKINESIFKPIEKGKDSLPYSRYFTNAIGVARKAILDKSSGKNINLLPTRLKEKQSIKKHISAMVIASVLITTISLLGSSMLAFKYQSLIYTRLSLEAQRSSVEKNLYGTRYQQIRDGINKFNNEVEALTKIDQTLFSIPTLLQDIEKLIPPSVTLTTLLFNDETLTVEMTGIASNRESLLLTQKNFENTVFVKEVIAPISNFDQKSQISFAFKISIDFTQLAQYGSSTSK